MNKKMKILQQITPIQRKMKKRKIKKSKIINKLMMKMKISKMNHNNNLIIFSINKNKNFYKKEKI